METSQAYQQIHQEHRQWLTELNFYHDEVKYYQNQLAQLSARDTDDQHHQRVVTFKRRFFDILEQIDELRYAIYKHERELAQREQLAERTQVHVNEDHHTRHDEIAEFRKTYEQLKSDFNHFARTLMSA